MSTRASDELAEARVLTTPELSQRIAVLTSTTRERESWTFLHKNKLPYSQGGGTAYAKQGSGVILILFTPGARQTKQGF